MFFCLFFDILQYLCPIIKTTKDMQQNIIGRKREINLLEISQEENWNEP